MASSSAAQVSGDSEIPKGGRRESLALIRARLTKEGGPLAREVEDVIWSELSRQYERGYRDGWGSIMTPRSNDHPHRWYHEWVQEVKLVLFNRAKMKSALSQLVIVVVATCAAAAVSVHLASSGGDSKAATAHTAKR